MSGYGFKKGDGGRLPIVITKENAISRGRFIKNVEYRKNDTAEWLTIEVADKAGNTARKSYFPAKIGSGFVTTQEQVTKEQQKFNRTMENLTKVLLSSNYETGEVNTFEEFCKKVIFDIGKSYYDKELRIKLVYDSKNRPTLPNYPTMFEDPSLVSDENTKMKITDWDKVVPTAIKMDEDKKKDDLELDLKKKEDDDSDLPF
jgi:hypothetical protein